MIKHEPKIKDSHIMAIREQHSFVNMTTTRQKLCHFANRNIDKHHV